MLTLYPGLLTHKETFHHFTLPIPPMPLSNFYDLTSFLTSSDHALLQPHHIASRPCEGVAISARSAPEHEPEIWWKIESKLRTRLSLKPCRKMYFRKTMQKLSTNKRTRTVIYLLTYEGLTAFRPFSLIFAN